MESHAIPQNVTDFEFHLVGDMTLKQFMYLALGLGLAYLVFVFLATPLPYIAWPLIVVLSLFGVAFAFLPISERPLDHWIKAFLKAVFSPTKRIWVHKNIKTADLVFKDRLNIFLTKFIIVPEIASNMPKLSTISQFAPITQSIITSQSPATSVPIEPNLSEKKVSPEQNLEREPNDVKKDVKVTENRTVKVSPDKNGLNYPSNEEIIHELETAKQAQNVQSRIVETQKKLEEIKALAAKPGADTIKIKEQFQNVLLALETLNKQASEISRELITKVNTSIQPGVEIIHAVSVPPTTKNVTLTQIPNVINGIITDSQGNYIEGVIVVTHDKAGLPVRALKTNKLGQFIAVTPLPNGTYTISLEKENLTFDAYKVELKGEVMPPILIAAKRGVL